MMKTQIWKRLCSLLIAISFLVCSGNASAVERVKSAHGEILWDKYGVPHIFAKDAAGVFYGFGYAQAKAHGDLLLHLYGESRGRAAEYWGEKYAESDRYLAANHVWSRAQDWFQQQTPAMQANLNAFAEGINAYAKEHPDKLAAEDKVVLPVSGLDVMAHWEHVMQFLYIAPLRKVYPDSTAIATLNMPEFHENEAHDDAGSNAWAIAPSRTTEGHAILLSNPHLAWAPSFMTYFEAQLSAPGIDMYGATQVGFPVLRFCFNEDHGLTNTVNSIAAATIYHLKPSGDGYIYDGKVMEYKTGSATIKVKQADGSLKEEAVTLREAVQGPAFTRADGSVVALRVAGLDRPFGIQEYWDLDKAHGLTEFISILKRLQVPMFNMVYADHDGHILYQYNGVVPVLPKGDFAYWSGTVPGDTSATLWTKIHPYEDLPRTLDPEAGWVQNTNNPPWMNTAPPALDPAKFPAYMSPVNMTFRAEQSSLLLMNKPKQSFPDYIKLKMTTRSLLADRMLPELLVAAKKSDHPLVQQSVALLESWDHAYDNDSKAALLFELWAGKFTGPQFSGQNNFAHLWTLQDMLTTPNGIKNPDAAVAMLEAAAKECIAKYGKLDRPFGEVSRFHIGSVNVPGNGGYGNIGIFRVITWSPLKNGERIPLHGETFISMVQFSKPMKAEGIVTYGESSQPNDKHSGDQLSLLSNKQLRTLWRTRSEIEKNLEDRKSF